MKTKTLLTIHSAIILVLAAVGPATFATPPGDRKTLLLDCMKEMTEFCKSKGATEFLVDGKYSEDLYLARMDEIVRKYFKDLDAWDMAAREFESDPAYQAAEKDHIKALRETITLPDETMGPGDGKEAPKGVSAEERAKMIACIRDMVEILRSESARDYFVGGKLDSKKLKGKLEEIALKRFKDMAEFEGIAGQRDPEIEKAGKDLLDAMEACRKKYGAPSPAPGD
ncbi:MAG: hypothetical protein KA419_10325 [Acidobacteria bacterium]|nr:hypothetical protein [Acidobacteriota bacterium]